MSDNENIDKSENAEEQSQQGNSEQFKEVLEQVVPEESSVGEESLPRDAINMVTLSHLLGLIGIWVPLVVWLLKKDEHRFVNEQLKEILNYQMSLMIYFLVGWLLCFVFIGLVILPVLMLMHVIFVIIATVKSSEGKAYHYPIAIEFLK